MAEPVEPLFITIFCENKRHADMQERDNWRSVNSERDVPPGRCYATIFGDSRWRCCCCGKPVKVAW